MTLVIGVDPGGTTGISVVRYTPEEGYDHRAWSASDLGPADLAVCLGGFVTHHAPGGLEGPWWIAAERFVVSRRAGRSATAAAGERARATLGALEAAYPGRVKLANASAAKGWATDDRLKRAGLWSTGPRAAHTRDAARHALRFHVVHLGNPDPLSMDFELAELERRRG